MGPQAPLTRSVASNFLIQALRLPPSFHEEKSHLQIQLNVTEVWLALLTLFQQTAASFYLGQASQNTMFTSVCFFRIPICFCSRKHSGFRLRLLPVSCPRMDLPLSGCRIITRSWRRPMSLLGH